MRMPYILAHDLGTTGNKANLFDETGALVASHLETYDVSYPQAGWAEQDPDDWWRAVCTSSRALLAQSGVGARTGDIAVVTFSGQMMGVVAVDASHMPLRSAIIWADQRAVDEAKLVAGTCGDDAVYARTGHRISPAYCLEKFLWLKRNQADMYAATRWFLTAKDYCVLRLTGVAATDYSDASGTNVFDLMARDWCYDFLDALEIDSAKFPKPVPSTHVVGHVTPAASEATGLVAGIPVVIGGGDGACATIGAGAVAQGDAYCVLGTSSWIAYSSARPLIDPARRVFTFHNLPIDTTNSYMPTGTMQTACGARDWLARAIGEQHEDALQIVPAGCDGAMFLPYLIGERSPWWNPNARAAFVGLAMNHGPAHLMRAVLEGVAMNLRLILDAFSGDQQQPFGSLRLIGGGARSGVWRQILADVLNVRIDIPELLSEATSWGAAVAGGIGVGLYADWTIAKSRTRILEVVEPDAKSVQVYAERLAVFCSVYHALVPIQPSFKPSFS